MLNREKTIHSINNIIEHFEIKFQELPYVNKINLRFDPNNNVYMSSCRKILGDLLPTKPNTYVQNDTWLMSFVCSLLMTECVQH